jgi:hypothetical protein
MPPSPGDSPLASPARGTRARDVKAWVRETLALPEDAVVMVTQLECTEPGCPPLEVVMAVLRPGEPPVQRKLHGALDTLTREEVRAAWSAPAEHTHEEAHHE